MRQLTPDLHADFVTRARKVSRALATEITAIGPIGYPPRSTRDLPLHLARIIVGQQLSTKAAQSIWARVAEAAASAPQPLDFLVAENVPALRACGLSGAKVEALLALRVATAEGRLDARKLGKQAHPERAAALTALRGIGPWTADMVSMFFFRDPDIWPLGDLAVRKTFERYVEGHKRLDLHSGGALFAPYRSFLALYMWRIANNGPVD